jgi:cardiolipin synthase
MRSRGPAKDSQRYSAQNALRIKDYMNIPNTITILRIIVVPLLVYLLINGSYTGALWLLAGAGISDALDGFIARRFGMTTYLGSILDPLADKLLITVSALALAWTGLLPWWLAVVICLRDLVIVVGATAYYLRAGKIEMSPSIPGKLSTFLQFLLIFLLLGNAAGLVHAARALPALFVLVLLTALFSGGHYMLVWGRKGAALKSGATGGR